jgi:heat shock protein HslJ
MRIRTTFAVLAIAAVSLTACSSAGGDSGSAKGGSLDGKIWVLETYEANGTRSEVPGDVTVDAEFDASTSTVSGTAGCNRYNGPYTASGSTLTFGTLATTMMACVGPSADIEQIYLANLAAAKTTPRPRTP